MDSYIANRFNNFSLNKVKETNNQIIFYLSNTTFTASCTKCSTESINVHQSLSKQYQLSYLSKTTQITFNQRKFKCKYILFSKVFMEELSFVNGKRPYSSYLIDKIMKIKIKQ